MAFSIVLKHRLFCRQPIAADIIELSFKKSLVKIILKTSAR